MTPATFITGLVKQAAALDDLRQAKFHSDRGEYRSKRRILTRMMAASPDDWEIDQPDERMPGIRHKPSGWKFHLPGRHVKPVLEKMAALPIKPIMQAIGLTRTPQQVMNSAKAMMPLRRQFGFANLAAPKPGPMTVPVSTLPAAPGRFDAPIAAAKTLGGVPDKIRVSAGQLSGPGFRPPGAAGMYHPQVQVSTLSGQVVPFSMATSLAEPGTAAAGMVRRHEVLHGLADYASRNVQAGLPLPANLPSSLGRVAARPYGPQHTILDELTATLGGNRTLAQKAQLLRPSVAGQLLSSYGSNYASRGMSAGYTVPMRVAGKTLQYAPAVAAIGGAGAAAGPAWNAYAPTSWQEGAFSLFGGVRSDKANQNLASRDENTVQ